MGKISNVLTMIQLLSTGRKYNIEELSNILEVSNRMVRVYKEEMEKAGIYVDTIRGPYGGYILNQSIRIPNRKFKYSDVELLKKVITEVSDKNLKKEFEILIDKVHGVYHGSKKEERELNLNEETLLKYNLLMRAIKEKRKVKLLYYSYNKGELERIIHPVDMFYYDDGWYVSAFCELREDIRHFELKRITKYELLDRIL